MDISSSLKPARPSTRRDRKEMYQVVVSRMPQWPAQSSSAMYRVHILLFRPSPIVSYLFQASLALASSSSPCLHLRRHRPVLWLQGRASQRRGVSAGNWDCVVSLFTWRRRDMLVLSLLWRRRACRSWCGIEAFLRSAGSGVMSLDGRSLQLEG